MAKKIWVIILCCMALPYLYWYLLISKFTPVHYLQHYAQTFADAFQNSLRRSVLFERGQHNSSVTSGADVTGSNDVPNSEDIIKQPLKNGSKDETEDEEEGAVDSDKIDSPANGKKKDSARIPLKKILIWNKNFGLGSGRSAFLRFGCKYNACTVTNKRNLYRYEELDAVIWHVRSKDKSFPPIRSPHTRYIFMNAEPPGHVKRLQKYKNKFNWTLTYRWDSEISMRIGQVLPRKEPKKDNSKINYAKGKTKMAAWFVSNCGTDGGRSQITRQLQKYFPVDVYGKCGPFKCPRFTKVDCYKKAERRYKFYLSFENSLCKDYVTEKFFKILLYNMVPVVYGGADYKAIAPEKSYINVRDFPNIKELAKHLLYLNDNDTAYNEYFWWKRYYDVLAVGDSKNLAWCDLCERLHTDTKSRVYPDVRQWFIKEARCLTTKSKSIRNFVNGL